VIFHCDSPPFWELWLKLGKVSCVGPVVLVRCSKDLEYFEDLIDLRVTSEQRSSLSHLGENATSRPQVHTKTVRLLTQKDFRASIPKCYHFVGVGLDGEAEGAGQTKISELDLGACRVDEQILGLQVPVEDSVLMAVDEGVQDLEEEAHRLFFGQRRITA